MAGSILGQDSWFRFLLHAALGALLWAGAWITLGYACADAIGFLAREAARVGAPLAVGIAVALIVYLVITYLKRRRFLDHLRQARITARTAP